MTCCFVLPGDRCDTNYKPPAKSVVMSTSPRRTWCRTPGTNSWIITRISMPWFLVVVHRLIERAG